MEYKAELYYNPIFNFLKYYQEQKLTDCEIVFTGTNKPPLKAHAIILANSSIPFRKVMQAGGTTTFEIYENPMDLFPKVLEFLYCGKLEYTNDQVMALLHIARKYDIPALKDRMVSHLRSTVNHDNIYMFADKCYQYDLEEVLTDPEEGLVPLFVANFDKLSIQNLTKNLDVITFCLILERLSPSEYTAERKIKILDEFIGDFECDDEEKQACLNLFSQGDKKVRALLSKGKYKWLP